MSREPRKPPNDPAVALAAKLDVYARSLSAEEHRILEAMLVMAMDPLDRQARRLRPVLTDDEATKAAALLRAD